MSDSVVDVINHTGRLRESTSYHVAMEPFGADQSNDGRIFQPPCRRAGVLQGSGVPAMEKGAGQGLRNDPPVPASTWRRTKPSCRGRRPRKEVARAMDVRLDLWRRRICHHRSICQSLSANKKAMRSRSRMASRWHHANRAVQLLCRLQPAAILRRAWQELGTNTSEKCTASYV